MYIKTPWSLLQYNVSVVSCLLQTSLQCVYSLQQGTEPQRFLGCMFKHLVVTFLTSEIQKY